METPRKHSTPTRLAPWYGQIAALLLSLAMMAVASGPVLAALTPNDPLFSQQWSLDKIAAPSAWDLTTGSSSVVLAVVDTGVDPTHPDLQGRLLTGTNTLTGTANTADDHGRGTALAGLAAAASNNAIGIAGLAWQPQLLPVKIAGPLGSDTDAAFAAGLRFAVDQGARIILTGAAGMGTSDLKQAVQYALDRDVLLVAAAGDGGIAGVTYPASHPGVLAVAATDPNDLLLVDGPIRSNSGASVAIAAPGYKLLSTVPSGACTFCAPSGYRPVSSTAAAAAQVAGAAALLRALHPTWSAAQVRDRLTATTDPLHPLDASKVPNAGRLNVARAVGAAVPPVPAAPSAPSGLAAGTVTANSIEVRWSDTASNESYVELIYIEETGAKGSWNVRWLGPNSTAATVSGLTAGTMYYFNVRACNTGGCSRWLSTLMVATLASPTVTVPAAPSNLRAGGVTETSIQVLWNDNSSDEARFELLYKASSASAWTTLTYAAGTTATTVSGLAAATGYDFMVRACNDAGCSGWSNTLTVSTASPAPTVPAAPSNLRAGSITTTSIQVLWDDNSSNEARFELMYSPTALISWTTLMMGSNSTSATVSGLLAGTGYTFYVRACNDAGCSSWSNTLNASTASAAPTVPAAPSNLRAGSVTTTSIQAIWDDNSGNESRFELVYSPTSTSVWTTLTLGSDTTSATVSGLTADTSYSFWVRACNDAGCSGWSNNLNASTATVAPTVPAAPSNLRAGGVTETSIQVLWDDNSSNETRFELTYKASSATTWITLTYGAGTTAATVSGLTAGASYSFMVRACNDAGCSSWSNTLTASTSSATVPVPAAPSNLRVGSVTTSSIQVLWDDNSSNESRFELYYRAAGSASWSTLTLGSNATSATVSGLAAGASYDFMVRACNDGGCSNWSNTLTASTANATTGKCVGRGAKKCS